MKFMISILLFILIFHFNEIQGQNKYALLIGISEYEINENEFGSWSNIHGENDVKLLSKTLQEQDFYIKQVCGKKATASRIRKELNLLSDKCKKDDIVYIHFSCHGQPVEDLNGDELEGWDEALVPFDAKKVYQEGVYEGENHILDDELNDYFVAIRTKIEKNGFLYVIVDACHAGSSYRGEEERVITRGTNRGFSALNKPFVPRIDKRGRIRVEQFESMSEICILEACRSYQINSEIEEDGIYYGSLSYYVNQVLQTIKLGKDTIWINKVASLMNEDIRLVRQNMVIETSF